MQLPIDVKALLDEITNIKSARETRLSVSVYIDDSAPAELVAHVRNVFASSQASVRMTVSYLDDTFLPHPTDDVAVIAAGHSRAVGKCAAEIRAVGVPVMIATTEPVSITRIAQDSGNPIPDGDIVSPYREVAGEGSAEGNKEDVEPYVWNEDLEAELDSRMGKWIVSVCREKKLAFAIAFPFMRRPLAHETVQITALENAGVGLIPLIPGADLPIMTLNQAKMVLQIAAAYGQEMDKARLKEIAAVIGGAYLCRTLARELVEFVPVLGFLVRTGIAYGGTAAIGYAVVEYFEGGENLVGVASVASRAIEKGAATLTSLQQSSE